MAPAPPAPPLGPSPVGTHYLVAFGLGLCLAAAIMTYCAWFLMRHSEQLVLIQTDQLVQQARKAVEASGAAAGGAPSGQQAPQDPNATLHAVTLLRQARLVESKMVLIMIAEMAALAFGFIGFALFLLGITGESDVETSSGTWTVRMLRLAPGTVVLGFSTALFGVCVTRPFTFQDVAGGAVAASPGVQSGRKADEKPGLDGGHNTSASFSSETDFLESRATDLRTFVEIMKSSAPWDRYSEALTIQRRFLDQSEVMELGGGPDQTMSSIRKAYASAADTFSSRPISPEDATPPAGSTPDAIRKHQGSERERALSKAKAAETTLELFQKALIDLKANHATQARQQGAAQ